MNLCWTVQIAKRYVTRDGKSEEAFHYDLAVEAFGTDYMERLVTEQDGFQGDWFQLAFLLRCHETQTEKRGLDEDQYCLCPFCQPDWKDTHLENASLAHTNLENAPLNGVHLENASLTGASLKNIGLGDAQLEGANLIFADLENANLIGANLKNASLAEANLKNAQIGYANLEGVSLWNANLENADVRKTNLKNANISEANLKNASLFEANLQNANLRGANLTSVALKGTILNAADVRGAKGVIFDSTPLEKIIIDGNTSDPWSVLRRAYTGPNFFFHLILLVAFFLPFFGKAMVLTGIHEGMVLVDKNLDGSPQDLRILHEMWEAIERQTAFWTLLGYGNNNFGTFAFFLLTLMMVAYNIIRFYLTRQVSFLRDDEDRTKITPSRKEYMGKTIRRLDSYPLPVVHYLMWKTWKYAFLKWWKNACSAWTKALYFTLRKLWDTEVLVWEQRKNGNFYIGIAIVVIVYAGFCYLDEFFLWLLYLICLIGVVGGIFGIAKRKDKKEAKWVDFGSNLFPPSPIKYIGLFHIHRVANVFMIIAYCALVFQICRWLWFTQIPTY